jgi:hypothetical protein
MPSAILLLHGAPLLTVFAFHIEGRPAPAIDISRRAGLSGLENH